MPAPLAPIIIFKKKKGHGGHHGGAWKVAYADFVTAMMALFIVLWLLSSSQEVKTAIAGYFRDPKGLGNQSGDSLGGTGQSLTITKDNMDLLKKKLEQAIKKSPEFEKMKDHVQMTITGEGLRIELLESEKGVFFANGKPTPTEVGRSLLMQLAEQLGTMKNTIFVEGHTDAKPYDSDAYSNWELSADRANAARQIMQEDGLRQNQVTQVRGFADGQLRVPGKPEDASNRRISIIVQYLHDDSPAAAPSAAKNEGEGGAEKTAEHSAPPTPAKEHGGEAQKAPEKGAAEPTPKKKN